MESAKIIGLSYLGEIHYAMFLNAGAFSTEREGALMETYAGLDEVRGGKVLFMCPLSDLSGGAAMFTSMPGSMSPREPYVLAYGFLLGRWAELSSGAIVDVDKLVRMRGMPGATVDCLIPQDA